MSRFYKPNFSLYLRKFGFNIKTFFNSISHKRTVRRLEIYSWKITSAANKTSVFGMLKIDGKIYNRSASEPIPSIVSLIANYLLRLLESLWWLG